jgi:hypothetical protein
MTRIRERSRTSFFAIPGIAIARRVGRSRRRSQPDGFGHGGRFFSGSSGILVGGYCRFLAESPGLVSDTTGLVFARRTVSSPGRGGWQDVLRANGPCVCIAQPNGLGIRVSPRKTGPTARQFARCPSLNDSQKRRRSRSAIDKVANGRAVGPLGKMIALTPRPMAWARQMMGPLARKSRCRGCRLTATKYLEEPFFRSANHRSKGKRPAHRKISARAVCDSRQIRTEPTIPGTGPFDQPGVQRYPGVSTNDTLSGAACPRPLQRLVGLYLYPRNLYWPHCL